MIERQHQHETYEEFIKEIQYLTRMITDQQILDRMKDYQHLTENGWDNNPKYGFVKESCDAIRCCFVWIAENTTKTVTLRKKYGSYAYKHFVERTYSADHYHQYIPNGAFIAAAIMQGYRYEINNRLNCDFNMAMPLAMQKQVRGY
jgi:hypothetical protein